MDEIYVIHNWGKPEGAFTEEEDARIVGGYLGVKAFKVKLNNKILMAKALEGKRKKEESAKLEAEKQRKAKEDKDRKAEEKKQSKIAKLMENPITINQWRAGKGLPLVEGLSGDVIINQ